MIRGMYRYSIKLDYADVCMRFHVQKNVNTFGAQKVMSHIVMISCLCGVSMCCVLLGWTIARETPKPVSSFINSRPIAVAHKIYNDSGP